MNDEAINAAIDLLRSQGFTITRPEWGPWTTSADLQAQFPQLSQGGFFKRLHSFPGEYPAERGASGRLKRLRTTHELLTWLAQPLERGKRNDLAKAP